MKAEPKFYHHPIYCRVGYCRVVHPEFNPLGEPVSSCREYNDGVHAERKRAANYLQTTANECVKDGDFEAVDNFANAAMWLRRGDHDNEEE